MSVPPTLNAWREGLRRGRAEGRESMREAVRRWLESKSAGMTVARLLEDLDEEVPL